ncbi:putative copper resistance protein D [Arthrobacter subterraneus]|uniref:Putative copper resistance protein D n=1 Tax=Arthrobacter subterraneus TaxID=335973 RepID=A0A1G8NS57_9MICC|nr:cytochrome c oxidase assembly protein [Arthrobacter subterraneus]SDI82796.1 putative copper resistance protein D [Arthrobacter subterraneus]
MSMVLRGAAVAALAVAAVLALIWAFIYGGSAELGVLDRVGPTVLWLLLAAKLVFNLAAACTAGPLVLALFVVAPDEPAHRQALRFAGYSALVWALAAGVFAVANFQVIANMPLVSDGFVPALFAFLIDEDPGRSGLMATGIAATTALLCFVVRRQSAVALTAALAFSGLIPLVLNSHAAGGADHADSTMSLYLHSAAAVVWLGGLAGLLWLRPSLEPGRLGTVVRRYSTLALLSFIVLAVSGVLAAWVAIGSLTQIGTPYGVIVLFKSAAFTILGIFGALHRLWVIRRLDSVPPRAARYFWSLVVVELAVMGTASGLAASLARTETPTSLGLAASQDPPPAPTLGNVLSQWELDPLWSVVCAVGVFTYLAGVRRTRKAGRRWPASRTVLWLTGMVLLFLVTNGGTHVYQGYLFNAHVVTQMLLTAVVPLFLVMAAPLTLAELTIRPRTDGSTGCLEMTRSILRPVLKMTAATPYLPVLLLAGTLVVFYYSPLLGYAALSQLGYGIVTLLALSSGCLYMAALTAVPAPGQQLQLTVRLGAVVGTALLFGVYGQAISAQATVLEQPWYTAVGRPWGQHPFIAPELAGTIMWVIAGGALATAALIIVLRRTVLRRTVGDRAAESLEENPHPEPGISPKASILR